MPNPSRSARRPVVAGLLTMIAVVLALLGTAGTALAHNTNAPATPGNINQGSHDWSYNGCSTPGAAVNSQPGVFDFTHACIHHDGCYQGLDRQGDPATISRRSCDSVFLSDMRGSCKYEHGADTTSPAAKKCYDTANLYYTGVRLFGRQYYTGEGSPA